MLRGNDSRGPLYSLDPLQGTLKDFYLHLHKGKGDMMFCAVNDYLCSKSVLKACERVHRNLHCSLDCLLMANRSFAI